MFQCVQSVWSLCKDEVKFIRVFNVLNVTEKLNWSGRRSASFSTGRYISYRSDRGRRGLGRGANRFSEGGRDGLSAEIATTAVARNTNLSPQEGVCVYERH